MDNNILYLKYCYGCGVCSSACPKKIISIKLDRNGFYKAFIKKDDCINCGICKDVCGFSHEEIALKECDIQAWAAWSNNSTIRKKCSSGGIGFEIGKQLIEKGYKSVGCRYNIKNQRAEHFIATSVEEFVQSIGSKYIQSYTEVAFKQIDRKQKYFITGTPCQIDSFRRMIQKFGCEENFILMDFFCHCVPSFYAWKAYVRMLEPKIGKITYVSFRNKFEFGWHDSWLMSIDGENTDETVKSDKLITYNELLKERKGFVNSRMSQGDKFYKLFLGDVCMGQQCEKDCKYKYNSSSADIRIGDLWGNTYRDDEAGVSAVVAFTKKGRSIIEELENVTLVDHPFEVVAEGQMRSNARHKETTRFVMFLLRHGYSLNGIPFKATMFAQKIVSKLKRIVKI